MTHININAAVCPKCGHAEGKVVESRRETFGSVCRRRECGSCRTRWSTIEVKLKGYERGNTVQNGVAEAKRSIAQAEAALSKVQAFLAELIAMN